MSLFDLTKRVAVLPARAPSLKRNPRNSKQLLPSVGCHAANNTGRSVALCFFHFAQRPWLPPGFGALHCASSFVCPCMFCPARRAPLPLEIYGRQLSSRLQTRATKSQLRSHALLPIAPGAAACRQRRRPAILHLHPTLTTSLSVWFLCVDSGCTHTHTSCMSAEFHL